MTTKERERNEARERLREWIKPGDTLFCILRHRSASGMSRVIDVKGVERNGGDLGILAYGYNIAQALGLRYDRDRDGIRVSGCGMDMGFHIVYELGHALFGDGYDCIGERCPSNDHSNGDRDYTPHRHKDGGYALRHRWL